MKLYKIVLIAVIIFFILAGGGCSRQSEQKKPLPPPVKIGVSLADMKRDGNKVIRKVMEERMKEERLEISFMDAKNDSAEQEKHVDKMIKDKVKSVVIQFVDPSAAPQMVQKLKQEDIKVVALDNLPLNTPVDAYIAPDHTRAGTLQVRFVQEALKVLTRGGQQQEEQSQQQGAQSQQLGGESQQQGGGGNQGAGQVTSAVGPAVAVQLPDSRPLKVLILQGDKKDRAALDITSANIAEIDTSPDLELLRVEPHPGWDTAQTTTVLAELMGSNKKPEVILANDSTLAVEAVKFLKEAGMEKQVITAGVGGNEEASAGIVSGEHDAEVDPMPELLGQYALDAASDLAEKDHWQYDRQVYNGDYSITTKIVPVRLIGKNNIYLLQERWKQIEKKVKEQQGGEAKQQGEQNSSPPEGEGSQQEGGGKQEQQQGQQGKQGEGTTLKITTGEGKVMEVKIDGTIKKIESEQKKQEKQQGQGGGQ